ncbi:IS1595 family transposase [Candidatus Binatus sp.]|jgi:transposase-like protein|uniref:IS1595 family transposase n=1 Tax=Candidatus Binatus sp. TaxID=2811406 RepID=UPI002FDB6351
METRTPTTLIDAVRYFADPDICLQTMVKVRWPNGVKCPTCGNHKIGFLANQRRWQCSAKHPKRQFSAKAGTIFEDSPIGLEKWLSVVWLLTNCKNGISSYEVARDLGVTQKTAWFMLHRVRLAMQSGAFWGKLEGEIEADETFIGGLARNMHKNKKAKITGTGGPGSGKAVMMGLLDRKSKQVRVVHVPNVQRDTLQTQVRKYVQGGSYVFTDAWLGYHGLDREYVHNVIDHAEAYVQGDVHTNTIENFWSLLKRGLKGTYVSVEPFHLFRYLDEQAFRYNERKTDDSDRFTRALSQVTGRRLTYKQLTGKIESAASPR